MCVLRESPVGMFAALPPTFRRLSSCAPGAPNPTIYSYLSEAAMGVAHLASNGFVQNDIKPGNILLLSPAPGCENGRAVLADFGIALGKQ